jgi:Cu/Ag efflux protein CusF
MKYLNEFKEYTAELAERAPQPLAQYAKTYAQTFDPQEIKGAIAQQKANLEKAQADLKVSAAKKKTSIVAKQREFKTLVKKLSQEYKRSKTALNRDMKDAPKADRKKALDDLKTHYITLMHGALANLEYWEMMEVDLKDETALAMRRNQRLSKMNIKLQRYAEHLGKDMSPTTARFWVAVRPYVIGALVGTAAVGAAAGLGVGAGYVGAKLIGTALGTAATQATLQMASRSMGTLDMLHEARSAHYAVRHWAQIDESRYESMSSADWDMFFDAMLDMLADIGRVLETELGRLFQSFGTRGIRLYPPTEDEVTTPVGRKWERTPRFEATFEADFYKDLEPRFYDDPSVVKMVGNVVASAVNQASDSKVEVWFEPEQHLDMSDEGLSFTLHIEPAR